MGVGRRQVRLAPLLLAVPSSTEEVHHTMIAPLIAIADDELDILDMLDVLLAVSGYRTVSTQTAAAIPALIQQHHPALLILDIVMERPDSGWHVLDGLRRDPATQRLPVLIYSGQADVAMRRTRHGFGVGERGEGCIAFGGEEQALKITAEGVTLIAFHNERVEELDIGFKGARSR